MPAQRDPKIQVALMESHAEPWLDEASEPRRFSGALDLVVTPLVWGITLGAPGVVSWYAMRAASWSLFAAACVYVALMVATTVTVLNLLRRMLPIRPGIYLLEHDRVPVYAWSLWSFLYQSNLVSLGLAGHLLPIPLRKLFYWMLGAKVGGGITVIGGYVAEPFLTTVEKGAMVGYGSMLLSHAVTRSPAGDTLLLGRIRVGERAIVGAGVIVLPGVEIGEGAVINAMSLVCTNTKVPAHEVWGGVPAKRIAKLEATPSKVS